MKRWSYKLFHPYQLNFGYSVCLSGGAEGRRWRAGGRSGTGTTPRTTGRGLAGECSGTGTTPHTSGRGLAGECSGTGTTLHTARRGMGLAGECSGTGTTLHTAVSSSLGDEHRCGGEEKIRAVCCKPSVHTEG